METRDYVFFVRFPQVSGLKCRMQEREHLQLKSLFDSEKKISFFLLSRQNFREITKPWTNFDFNIASYLFICLFVDWFIYFLTSRGFPTIEVQLVSKTAVSIFPEQTLSCPTGISQYILLSLHHAWYDIYMTLRVIRVCNTSACDCQDDSS